MANGVATIDIIGRMRGVGDDDHWDHQAQTSGLRVYKRIQGYISKASIVITDLARTATGSGVVRGIYLRNMSSRSLSILCGSLYMRYNSAVLGGASTFCASAMSTVDAMIRPGEMAFLRPPALSDVITPKRSCHLAALQGVQFEFISFGI